MQCEGNRPIPAPWGQATQQPGSWPGHTSDHHRRRPAGRTELLELEQMLAPEEMKGGLVSVPCRR